MFCVYVVQDDDLVKIGYSEKPEERFLEIKKDYPRLRKVHRVWFRDKEMARRVEAKLHQHFANHRRDHKGGTEWFSKGPVLRSLGPKPGSQDLKRMLGIR